MFSNDLCELPNYGFLTITGQDTFKFLQGQLTCDMNLLTPEHPLWGSHCNPKGRMISLFRLFSYQGDVLLQMPQTMIPIAEAALRKYAVFFKVQILHLHHLSIPATALSPNEWKYQNLGDGIPAVYPETSERFIPQMLSLDKMGGVSFSKGCYTGQEIIARTQYRGELKRHLQLFETASPLNVQPGDSLNIQDKTEMRAIGTVVDIASTRILAVTHDETLALFQTPVLHESGVEIVLKAT